MAAVVRDDRLVPPRLPVVLKDRRKNANVCERSCKDLSILIQKMRDDQSSNRQKPEGLVRWENKVGNSSRRSPH